MADFDHQVPKGGAGLYAWARRQEELHGDEANRQLKRYLK